MRLQVDLDVCQGHGKCYLTAPHLFAPDDTDDWGKPIVLEPEIDPIDAARLKAAEEAIKSCPEFAITLDGRSGR
jgi:ferredoxin